MSANIKKRLKAFPTTDSGLIEAKKYFIELRTMNHTHEDSYVIVEIRMGPDESIIMEKYPLLGQPCSEGVQIDKFGWSAVIPSTPDS